jgi:uncharacterized Fe-S cluster protein YjdI
METMPPRRLQTYSTDQITVTFDPTRCIHAAECIRAQPQVFDSRRLRWIQPALAPAAEVAEAVRRCPTGALHYEIPAGAAEAADQAISVRVERNGPLYVRGSVRVEREDGTAIAEGFRMALCRCGATQNAPFCDGSHRTAGFRG